MFLFGGRVGKGEACQLDTRTPLVPLNYAAEERLKAARPSYDIKEDLPSPNT